MNTSQTLRRGAQRSVVLLGALTIALTLTLGAACNPQTQPAAGRGDRAGKAGVGRTPGERSGTSTPTGAGTSTVPTARRPSADPIAVSFATEDGVEIKATLRVGASGTTPVVLVHQLGSTRAEWEPLVAQLAAEGLTTLALDLRGHGESTAGTGANARVYDYNAFRDLDWRATQKDVRAAIDFLAAHDAVRAARVVLIGSSIGGTACLAAAADDPRAGRVVVLSPGRAYHGFDAILPASRLGQRDLLVLHASEEIPSAETAEVLDRIVTNSTLAVVPGGAHGVAMLAEDPAQIAAIVEFVRAAQPQ